MIKTVAMQVREVERSRVDCFQNMDQMNFLSVLPYLHDTSAELYLLLLRLKASRRFNQELLQDGDQPGQLLHLPYCITCPFDVNGKELQS
eukprot:scaffold387317_cov103-Cyclotella_meneghiniana.AAC.4